MPTFSEELQDRALDLAWSLWAEMGVSGWTRQRTSAAIDPEALIIFTAALGDADPRLRDEATDWCIRYGRFVATTRLKNLLSRQPEHVRTAFGEFAATVADHSPHRWPLATEPRRYQPTGRSRIDDFQRPSLIALRLRALFGVTARAEIVRMFLAELADSMTASELAPEAGYTKRNVAESLDALRRAGLLEVGEVRNQLQYRLARKSELTALVGGLPKDFPRWHSFFAVLLRLLEFASTSQRLKPDVLTVEVHRVLSDLAPDLQSAGLRSPQLEPEDRDLWPRFTRWAIGLAESSASGEVNGGRGSAKPRSRTARVLS